MAQPFTVLQRALVAGRCWGRAPRRDRLAAGFQKPWLATPQPTQARTASARRSRTQRLDGLRDACSQPTAGLPRVDPPFILAVDALSAHLPSFDSRACRCSGAVQSGHALWATFRGDGSRHSRIRTLFSQPRHRLSLLFPARATRSSKCQNVAFPSISSEPQISVVMVMDTLPTTHLRPSSRRAHSLTHSLTHACCHAPTVEAASLFRLSQRMHRIPSPQPQSQAQGRAPTAFRHGQIAPCLPQALAGTIEARTHRYACMQRTHARICPSTCRRAHHPVHA
jgi:hypothetical protein